MALIETSALDSSNVSLAFECIIKGKRSLLSKNLILILILYRNLQTAAGLIASPGRRIFK